MRCAAHHMDPNMAPDNETPRTYQEDTNDDEEQVGRSCGTNRFISQVDSKSQTHMACHAPPEMKAQDCKNDYKGGVFMTNKWMINQSEGKENVMKRMI